MALILLGGGIRRGHRRAWAMSLALLVLSSFLHVAKGLDIEEATVAIGLAVYLAFRRDCFPAASCPQKTRVGILTIVLGAASATIAGGTALWLDPRHHPRPAILGPSRPPANASPASPRSPCPVASTGSSPLR